MSDANASSGDTTGALPDDDVWGRHSAFMEANLRRNYTTNLTHGVFGMTGFRLIYAPTIIPAYLYLLTGSAAAVGLGLQLWIPGLVLWAVGHSAAVFMARSDPDFMAVAGRSTRHKEHLKC